MSVAVQPSTAPRRLAATPRKTGFAPYLFGLLLLSTAIYSKSRDLVLNPQLDHVGIAKAVPAIPTYLVVMLLFVPLVVFFQIGIGGKRTMPWVGFAFPIALIVATPVIWSANDEQLAGVLQLLTGTLAWILAAFLTPRALRTRRGTRIMAASILLVVLIETLVSLAQVAGMSINPMPPDLQALMGSRVNGTTTHPDNLGKVMVLMIVLALGLLSTDDRRARRMLLATVGLAFVPLGVSQGRANALAAVALLMFWAVLSSDRRTLKIRLALPLAILLVAAPFVGTFASRVQEDPEGGPRAQLSAVAKEQIKMRPLTGTGPNSYVTVVSAYDPIVALGYPVHNAYYLTAAELGIPLAMLFWAPLAWLIWLSWKRRGSPGVSGSFAVVVVAATPGFFVITATGWAMLAGPMFPLWFLVMGVAYGAITAQPKATRGSVHNP